MKRGSDVTIYMPMIPELPAAMVLSSCTPSIAHAGDLPQHALQLAISSSRDISSGNQTLLHSPPPSCECVGVV